MILLVTAVEMSVGLCDHNNCQIKGRYRQYGKQNSWLYRGNYCDKSSVVPENSKHEEFEKVAGDYTGNKGNEAVRITVTETILSEDKVNLVNTFTEKVDRRVNNFQQKENKIPETEQKSRNNTNLFNENGMGQISEGSKVRRHKVCRSR